MTVVKDPEEILGAEYDWLARDACGHVGFFSTAGGSYAPPKFLRDTEIHDRAIEEILATRAGTEALYSPTLPVGRQNIWKLMAERGVFAFDGDAHGGPYRLVAAPKNPVHSAELPLAAIAALEKLMLSGVRFEQVTELSTDSLKAFGS